MNEIFDRNKVQKYLKQHVPDLILLNLDKDVITMSHKFWTSIENIENEINCYVNTIYKELRANQNDDNSLLINLECYMQEPLHDIIMPVYYKTYELEDTLFLDKCKTLNKTTAEQYGARNFVICFSAATVELASLDSKKSVLEKLNCLSNTFDLIYAEIKSEIAEISTENDAIPIIENWEIIPLLMNVIIRSKLVHIFSNFSYIQGYSDNVFNNTTRFILNSFETAIRNIYNMDFKIYRCVDNPLIEIDLISLANYDTIMNNISSPLMKNQYNKLFEQINNSTNDLK